MSRSPRAASSHANRSIRSRSSNPVAAERESADITSHYRNGTARHANRAAEGLRAEAGALRATVDRRRLRGIAITEPRTRQFCMDMGRATRRNRRILRRQLSARHKRLCFATVTAQLHSLRLTLGISFRPNYPVISGIRMRISQFGQSTWLHRFLWLR